MNEANLRKEANIWMIRNNHNLKSDITDNGLAKAIEDAFVAGASIAEDEIDDLRDSVDDLHDQLEEAREAIDDLRESIDVDDLSVENL